MSEYTGLLLDQLVTLSGGRIINIGTQTSPESVLTYYGDRPKNKKNLDRENLRKATIDFVNTTVLPKALKHQQEALHRPAAKFLYDGKMLFWQPRQVTVKEAIATAKKSFKGSMGNCGSDINRFLKHLTNNFRDQTVDFAIVEEIEAEIDTFMESYDTDPDNKKAKKTITSTAQSNLDKVVESLKQEAEKGSVDIPSNVSVSMATIVRWINDPDQSNLIIVQAHDPDSLREFAAQLSYVAYESRRRSGQITPLASFIFDEADEFIPGH
jgi:hypothetical protein